MRFHVLFLAVSLLVLQAFSILPSLPANTACMKFAGIGDTSQQSIDIWIANNIGVNTFLAKGQHLGGNGLPYWHMVYMPDWCTADCDFLSNSYPPEYINPAVLTGDCKDTVTTDCWTTPIGVYYSNAAGDIVSVKKNTPTNIFTCGDDESNCTEVFKYTNERYETWHKIGNRPLEIGGCVDNEGFVYEIPPEIMDAIEAYETGTNEQSYKDAYDEMMDEVRNVKDPNINTFNTDTLIIDSTTNTIDYSDQFDIMNSQLAQIDENTSVFNEDYDVIKTNEVKNTDTLLLDTLAGGLDSTIKNLTDSLLSSNDSLKLEQMDSVVNYIDSITNIVQDSLTLLLDSVFTLDFDNINTDCQLDKEIYIGGIFDKTFTLELCAWNIRPATLALIYLACSIVALMFFLKLMGGLF